VKTKRTFTKPASRCLLFLLGFIVLFFSSCRTAPVVVEEPRAPVRLPEPEVVEEVVEELPPVVEQVVEIDMVFIKGGCYEMGDTFGDGLWVERPVHEVCVNDFHLGTYEVTQKLWKEVMGNSRSHFEGCDDCPVEEVSWNDAQRFIDRLKDMTGLVYRLPTEAEWEYAARSRGMKDKWAGTSSQEELPDYAWFQANSENRTHPVGEKEPNELGLYDMSGNVWEWVEDIYLREAYGAHARQDPVNREKPEQANAIILNVYRGGSWNSAANFARTTHRGGDEPMAKYKNIGFRLVRVP